MSAPLGRCSSVHMRHMLAASSTSDRRNMSLH